MSEKMLKFTNIGQQNPPKREALTRRDDFNEIYSEYIHEKAAEQSSRCSQCGVPFCQIHCPLSNNIPDWLKLTAEGRLEEAYELAQSTNNMPEVCGRICPQDKLCEGNCVIEQSGHGTVTIGSVEKYITENAWNKGWIKPIKVKNEKKQSVGIIGAGPAGLACAEQLRKQGYQVTIYDRYDRSGGLLIYGIPNFKLEKHVVERRTKILEKSGIKFVQNSEVGKDSSLNQLREKHDAILIASGVYKPREIEISGSNLENIFPAMDFLTASNRKGLGDKVELFDKGILNSEKKDVVVIGGGDTAMDCVRTSVRQNAKSVKCLYRRDRENMPGSAREIANAEEEGVEFIWLSSPKEFLGTNKIERLIVNKIKLGDPDESGRKKPEIQKDSEFNLKADMVIKALGFDPENLPKLFGSEDLQVTKWGTLKTDFDTMETNLQGVFAAGDIIRGASLVVWAIKDGRDAATIYTYVRKMADYFVHDLNNEVLNDMGTLDVRIFGSGGSYWRHPIYNEFLYDFQNCFGCHVNMNTGHMPSTYFGWKDVVGMEYFHAIHSANDGYGGPGYMASWWAENFGTFGPEALQIIFNDVSGVDGHANTWCSNGNEENITYRDPENADDTFAIYCPAASILWDFFDTAIMNNLDEDDDNVSLSFKTLWDALGSVRVNSLKDLYDILLTLDVNNDGINDVTDHNLVDEIFDMHGAPGGFELN